MMLNSNEEHKNFTTVQTKQGYRKLFYLSGYLNQKKELLVKPRTHLYVYE